MARKWTIKTEFMMCQCGCGEWFTAEYKTRRPKYRNNAHKQKAYRDRQHKSMKPRIPKVAAPVNDFTPGRFAFGSVVALSQTR